jgi:thiol-disulfide isomerase/thioredoxin
VSLFSLRRHAGTASLPVESRLPRFDGATAWLNSAPLTAEDLRGHVVLIDFWTFTCINWIRTAPYLRAWDDRYRKHGLIMIGVHTPEFPFETDVDSISAAIEERRLAYPIAVDSDYAIWNGFGNRYWPALYVADGDGAIRFHHFGEGRYEESERVIQELLIVPRELRNDLVNVEADGVEAPADWGAMESPETYVGAERAEGCLAGRPTGDRRRAYSPPPRLKLNTWALSGEWTIDAMSAQLNEAGGQLFYRFRARDLNLVMVPAERAEPVRFQVRLNGSPPGAARGVDVDDSGEGTAACRRLYQLVRQPGDVDEHTFEITRVRHAGATGALTLRADAGFYAGKVVSACRRHGVAFSITARKNPAVQRAIDAIPAREWVAIPYWLEGGADVAETTYTAFAGTKHKTTPVDRPPRPAHPGQPARVGRGVLVSRDPDRPHWPDAGGGGRPPPPRDRGAHHPRPQTRCWAGAPAVRAVRGQRRLARARRRRVQPRAVDRQRRRTRTRHDQDPAADHHRRARPARDQRPTIPAADAHPMAMGRPHHHRPRDHQPHRPRARLTAAPRHTPSATTPFAAAPGDPPGASARRQIAAKPNPTRQQQQPSALTPGTTSRIRHPCIRVYTAAPDRLQVVRLMVDSGSG